MGTANVPNAAMQASEQSGIPASVLTPLIVQEGPTTSAPNNPFDITQGWANLAGFGSFVTSLWNSIGVAVFGSGNETQAIQAWAYGILNFTNYAGLRQTMQNPLSTVYDFYAGLAATGYSGCASGDTFCYQSYASSLGNLFKQQTGQDPTTTLLGASSQITTTPPVTVTPPITTPPSISGLPTTAPTNPTTANQPAFVAPTASTVPVIGPLIDSVNYAGASASYAVTSAVLSFERFFWIVIGLALAVIGLWVLVKSAESETEQANV